MSMQIVHVSDKGTVKDFHKLPFFIYKDDKSWVPPIRSMHEDIFNTQKNAGFKTGDACRWILKKDNNVIGRIAAFYETSLANSYEQPTGGVGFFECINDQKAAQKLFDTAHDWLKGAGMEAMDGPVNFGENFFNWGLLTEGFEQQTYGMQYHPKYYRQLFEDYGFKTYYKQFSYRMDITDPDLPERFWKIAAWVAKKPDFRYEHFKFINQEKYIADFIKIHEQAWRKHNNYKPVNPHDIRELINQSKSILDEEFLWYVYHKDEPIAFFMMLPDINQILKKLKSGEMGILNALRFLYLKKRKVISRCRVLILGVIPKFQRSGIESGIFHQLKQVMLRKPWYNEMEMSWVGDFNPKMNMLFKSFGADQSITHHTMRYLFDRKKPFKRMPILKE